MINDNFSRGRRPSPPLNWRRGIFRLWVLISTAWILGWMINFAIEFLNGEATERNLLALVIILFGPPLALLLLGGATRWAFLGFQGDDPDRASGA
jgi:hypothetical protein